MPHCGAEVLRSAAGARAQEEVFRRREEGLKKKDLELQASLIRFSKFLQARCGASRTQLFSGSSSRAPPGV